MSASTIEDAIASGAERMTCANAVRSRRKELLDELRHAPSILEAQERAAELLMGCDPALERLAVYQLLASCKGVGRAKAREILAAVGVNGMTRVGDLLARDALGLGRVLRRELPQAA
jgi:hypothetical protein